MNDLVALQQRFMASISQPNDAIAADLHSDGGISTQLGVHIYRHAYQARLLEVLDLDHAILATYIGDALWQELGLSYLDAHPSRQRSLRQFGDALPAFLAQHASSKAHPELAELARFERQLLDCFDAPDAPVATWAQLQELPATDWAGLRLCMVPSAHRFATTNNAVAIWIALKNHHSPPPARREASEWLCWRDIGLVTQFRSLEDEEATILDHFLAGGDFSAACELLLQWHSPAGVPARAIGLLAHWASEGLISQWMGHPA